MDKSKKEARRRQEDMALNRALLWVVGAVVLECLLLLVNRYYINYYPSEVDLAYLLWNGLKALQIGGAAVGVVCLVWAVLCFQKSGKTALPVILLLVCWALAICARVTLVYQKTGVQMLFLLVPAWAGLALVYYLYHREFFLGAAASGMSILGLWFVRYGGGLGLEVVLVLVGIVLVAGAALWLKRHDGLVCRGSGEAVRAMPKNTSYKMILASCLVGVAAVLAAAACGADIAYYLIFLMAAWLFAQLVYYTVKMM